MENVYIKKGIFAEEAFRNFLAKKFEIAKYVFLKDNVFITDVSKDSDYQKAFNGFYLVRRNTEWREKYYKCFQKVKMHEPSFCNIISTLNKELDGKIEPSFSSKMLATINPQMPMEQYLLLVVLLIIL